MATIKATRKFSILFSDGNSPQTWSHPCSINTNREFTIELSALDAPNVDCDDPDAPVWVKRIADSFSASISGAGKLDADDFDMWQAWSLSGAEKTIRVRVHDETDTAIGYYSGPFLLTSFGLSKADRGFIDFTCELTSAGALTWNAGAGS